MEPDDATRQPGTGRATRAGTRSDAGSAGRPEERGGARAGVAGGAAPEREPAGGPRAGSGRGSGGSRRPGPRRRALVTGASSGIGEAFARRLAADGYDLVLVARRADALSALAGDLEAKHGVGATPLPADLAAEEELARVEAAVAGEPPLDLLVNNAGFGVEGIFAEAPLAGQTAMIRVNVEAVVRLTHAALGTMLPRGRGAIINVSSGTAFYPMPYFAVYAASKAFVNSFTEAVAEEIRGRGVRLQALCPGFTRTRFQERAGMDSSRIPSFAWQSPEEVVEASLDALERGRLVCVPGALNQLMLAAPRGQLARSLVSRAAAAFERRARPAGGD